MNLEKICSEAIHLIRETGAYILKERQGFREDFVETKSLNSLVSFVDKEAEKRLVSGLEKLVPEAGFITEEGTSTKKSASLYWVIDPLDGTTNFIHGIPLYSISVALTRDGYPILGVVYEINLNECFYAWENSSAYLNGLQIHVSQNTELANSLVATGFPYHDFDRMPGFLDSLSYFMKNTRGLRRLGSAAVDLAYVACGRFDGFYEYGLQPWDVMAGAFIVERAGGKSGYFSKRNEFTDGSEILATNGHIHSEMEKTIQRFYIR